ncbi:hypothetical protein ACSBR1_005843 [Camellia fascicularis]
MVSTTADIHKLFRLCLKSSIFGRVHGILHHLGEVSENEKNSIVKFVLDPKLLAALVESRKRQAPYAGPFLLKDEPGTDPGVVSGSDTDKNIYVLKGKELFNRLNEVGTLAQITRIQGDQVVLIGHRRLRITEVVSEDPLTVKVDHLKDKPYNKDDDVIKATSFKVISTLRDVLMMSSLWRDHVQTYTQVCPFFQNCVSKIILLFFFTILEKLVFFGTFLLWIFQ